MIKLYRHALSGHAHRVELFLSVLDLEYELVDVDLMAGAHKDAEFLKMHPFGQVPVLNDNGVVLWDSNGILVYLARTYGGEVWSLGSAQDEAAIQGWLSIAAGPIAAGPASARLVTVFGANLDHDVAKARATALFETMNKILEGQSYLVGEKVSIADIAAYTYIAHAPEGGVALDSYPNIQAWISRIEALPNFVGMQKTPLSDAA
ncbi:glutathione S-transferase family protein [Kiloniella majae]|uniref:glutathione S-transferase family protein n=1 Tax=Kiloniella majae TaxID=1938558 RepID=UPI000A278ED0|nr:glutathione S-transferase [Kiloniella majae]